MTNHRQRETRSMGISEGWGLHRWEQSRAGMTMTYVKIMHLAWRDETFKIDQETLNQTVTVIKSTASLLTFPFQSNLKWQNIGKSIFKLKPLWNKRIRFFDKFLVSGVSGCPSLAFETSELTCSDKGSLLCISAANSTAKVTKICFALCRGASLQLPVRHYACLFVASSRNHANRRNHEFIFTSAKSPAVIGFRSFIFCLKCSFPFWLLLHCTKVWPYVDDTSIFHCWNQFSFDVNLFKWAFLLSVEKYQLEFLWA